MNKDKIIQYSVYVLMFGLVIVWPAWNLFFDGKELDSLPYPLPGVWEETSSELAYRQTIEFSEKSVRLDGNWKNVSQIIFNGDSETGLGKYEIYLKDDAFDFISVHLDKHGIIDVAGVDEAGEYRDGSPRFRSIDYGKYVRR